MRISPVVTKLLQIAAVSNVAVGAGMQGTLCKCTQTWQLIAA